MGDEAAQALELMERMLKLKEQGLQGEQITRHFIKCRLAPIKERSRTTFEFDGKHDPNREDPDSLDFKIMKERMYKIFSNAIVVSYSHQLPVVPYNAFNPPPQEYALMKSDPPITQRRSPRKHTVQGGGGPTIRTDPQPQSSNPTGQTGSRKRRLVLDDDEGDDDKSGDKGSPNKPPKRTMPRKKLAGRAMPKIRTSSRKPSDIDPTGKDPDPTATEPNLSKNAEPTAESQPTDKSQLTAESQPTGAHASDDQAGNQSATTETATTQEPPTGNQSDVGPDQEIPEVEAQTTTSEGPEAGNDSVVGSPDKRQGSSRVQLGTSSDTSGPPGNDEEEILRIKATDSSRPPILIKWWDENSQAAGIVINRQKEDEEVCQLKKALGEATRIVNDSNYELSGSSKAQAARMAQMEKQIEALKKDKAELAVQRDSALKEVEDRKIKSQAQFDVLVGKIKRLEGARDEVANVATPTTPRPKSAVSESVGKAPMCQQIICQ
uniref:OSIGBa0161P06.3 protein n=1 Tax=Oryza sativa TaxID=4530 RepID=Q01LS9_ORYSA|nr:OSIGBa0161P06.3 [Oryza sativa]